MWGLQTHLAIAEYWPWWVIHLLSDLPRGLLQTWARVETGMWYAHSAELMDTPLMDTLRWLRVIGCTIFAVGILFLGWFVIGLKTGWSLHNSVEKSIIDSEIKEIQNLDISNIIYR